jgi:hypothetical protein
VASGRTGGTCNTSSCVGARVFFPPELKRVGASRCSCGAPDQRETVEAGLVRQAEAHNLVAQLFADDFVGLAASAEGLRQ